MDDSQRLVARALLDIRAIHFNVDPPFTLTSGALSPVYTDCRKLISFPVQRKLVIEQACRLIQREGLAGPTTVIAGGETAGIPYAAWIAQQLDRPMIYVRKQPKGFGRLAQIEGELAPGTDVLLVEDLLFDAKSKIHFAQALRKAGAEVGHTLVVFDYGNAKSRAALQAECLTPHALTNWPTLLPLAQEVGYFTAAQAGVIREFLQDPAAWSAHRAQK